MSRAFWRYAPALALGVFAPLAPAQVGIGAFEGATLVDFETAPEAPVGSYYADLGVTMVNLSGALIFDTGTGVGDSWVACNYPPLQRQLPAGELRFDTPMRRVGFFITTHDPDDLTVHAYLGQTLVGSETFDTGGSGWGGTFAGVEFATDFDRVVIDPANNRNGFFCIDDLRFGSAPSELEVEVDIKPGSHPNSINPRSNGVTPVAILSTADFDSTTEIDRASLSFGPAGAPVDERGRLGSQRPACGVEDVNADGRADLVCRFDTRAAGFSAGYVEGTVKGQTRAGMPLTGSDSVVIVR